MNTLVIGIGNRDRGDDALGCLVAEAVKLAVSEGVCVVEHDGEPATLMDLWQGFDWVIVVDVVRIGRPPGSLCHFDLAAQPLPPQFNRTSTHAFGLAEAVELGRALGKLPAHLQFYGAEGKSFEAGAQLSQELRSSLGTLRGMILETIQKHAHA